MGEPEKRQRAFPKNVEIIREGDAGNQIYFLVKGRVAVVVGGRDVHTIHPGDFFGEIAGILGVMRTATVVAREYSEVQEFRGLGDGELYEFLRERPPQVLQAFLKSLASKLMESSRSQNATLGERDREIERLREAIAGTLAVLEGTIQKMGENEILHDVREHLKGSSGIEKGDIRAIEPKHLPYLKSVLYPSAKET